MNDRLFLLTFQCLHKLLEYSIKRELIELELGEAAEFILDFHGFVPKETLEAGPDVDQVLELALVQL